MSAAAAPTTPGPEAAPPRVPPSLGRGIAIAVLYAAVFLAAGVVSGVDYDELSESSSNVLGFVVVPVGLGIAAVLAVSWRWGWWQALFHEPRLEQPRWARAIPVLWMLVIVTTLIVAPWGDWGAGLVLLILAGTLLVGFGEEIVFRGYVLVGARSRFSEAGAWFISTLLFALLHGLNIVTGQALGATVQQIVFAFVFGTALYFIRRVTGLLVVGMVLHGLWDFATFVGHGPGDDENGVPVSHLISMPFLYVLIGFTIAAAIVVLRRER